MGISKFIILAFGPVTAMMCVLILMDKRSLAGIHSMFAKFVHFLRKTAHFALGVFRTSRKNDSQIVLKELPELLDIISLSMGAGTGFDSALALYCSRNQGILACRFARALDEWRTGLRTREEALNVLTHEYEVPELTSFVESVNEALRMGAPVTSALQGQSANVRKKWKYCVSVKIERAPVKMLLPVGTLVLPALLLSILGPLAGSLS